MSNDSTSRALQTSSVAISFAATMIAMWSFTRTHIAWGGYNLAIALVALAVVVAVRARGRRSGEET